MGKIRYNTISSRATNKVLRQKTNLDILNHRKEKNMIPCARTFDGKNFYEYEGITYYRWYYLKERFNYKMRVKFVSTNSVHRQGIALFFGENFVGELKLNGKTLENLKGFQHYVFKEKEFENDEFELEVHSTEGYLFFANSSDENGYSKCGAYHCAFWIETISENIFRFHCNDHDRDDDFDDLIFDLEIESLSAE